MKHSNALNWIRLITVSIIWGGAFFGVTIALRDFTPLQVAGYRVVIAAIGLYALMRWKGVTFPSSANRRVWLFILAIAFLSSAIPFSLLSWGQQHVPSAFAGISMASVPLFVLPLAHIFVASETLTLRKGIGFLIGFVGTLILVGGDGIFTVNSTTDALARLACVAAAICYALGSVTTRNCPDVNELALSTASLIIAAIMLITISLIVDGIPTDVSPTGVVALLYLGLLPTAVAFILKVAIIRSAGPSFMSLVNYLVPIWSIIFGALLLSEALPSKLYLGLVLIFIGLVISQWFTLRRILTGQPSP